MLGRSGIVALVLLLALAAIGVLATSRGGDASTPTAAPARPAATVRFAVIGDYGNGSSSEAAVAGLVKSWALDFVITTGDNNYPRGEADTIDANVGRYYSHFIGGYSGSFGAGAESNRFFPSLGNHDWLTREDTPEAPLPYLDYFTLPGIAGNSSGNERYYDFVRGPVHFFAVDSDGHEADGISSGSAQAEWLRVQMTASEAPWKLVYMHHPPFSSGSHGPTAELQWPYGDWGATAVIAGHDHTYERIERDGVLFLVNGLGGKSRYDFAAPVAGSIVRYNADFGAMLVEASASSITFEFYSIADGGTLIDRVRLTRDEGSRQPAGARGAVIGGGRR